MMGKLYIVSTPIGNLQDITKRAVDTLFFVDYIACEDTRHSGMLINSLFREYKTESQKQPKLISYYEEVEQIKSAEILKYLKSGFNVALISDAGTPLISDPGFRLISLCQKIGIEIIPVPGVSALLTVLVVSSLPTNNFWFIGFLPSKSGKCSLYLKKIQESLLNMENSLPSPTVIFYESPFRIFSTLKILLEVFGDINLCIGRELTKIHEEIKTRSLTEWIKYFAKEKPKGEFTLLFNLKF